MANRALFQTQQAILGSLHSTRKLFDPVCIIRPVCPLYLFCKHGLVEKHVGCLVPLHVHVVALAGRQHGQH